VTGPAGRHAIVLPDDISDEVGATIEPTGIAIGAAMKSEPKIGDTVVIVGAGTIGQAAWQIFKAMGVGTVIVTEVAEKRLEVAKAMGADIVINSARENSVERVLEVTSGEGADIVCIFTASTAAFEQAFAMVRGGGQYEVNVLKKPRAGIDVMSLGGKVVMVAGPRDLAEWGAARSVVQKALTIIGSWGGSFQEAFDFIRTGKVNTKPLITHEFPLEKINEAFETQLELDKSIKVIVKP
jgi:threonine 3-dehydrogenase